METINILSIAFCAEERKVQVNISSDLKSYQLDEVFTKAFEKRLRKKIEESLIKTEFREILSSIKYDERCIWTDRFKGKTHYYVFIPII